MQSSLQVRKDNGVDDVLKEKTKGNHYSFFDKWFQNYKYYYSILRRIVLMELRLAMFQTGTMQIYHI